MKKLLIALCCVAVILEGCNGCKENNPAIVWPVPVVPGNDSSYVLPSGSVPAAALHNVLIEEFSGQSCSNCPGGHIVLDGIASANVGRVNVVTMYANVSPQCDPPTGATYDFRNATALSIAGWVYSNIPNGLPAAGIDRTPVGGSYELSGSGLWSGTTTTQLTIPDSINLGISCSFNATTGVATIVDTVTYLYTVYNQQNVSIYILEDSLKDFQEYGITIDSSYWFMDVFRAMVNTNFQGDAVLPSLTSKPAGQVYWRRYTFNTTGLIVNPAHCRVVAFINNPGTGGDFRVLQSVHCNLE